MAENIFDGMQDAAYDVVSTTMGYDATWTPSTGGDEQTARVLFNSPTDNKKLAGVEYDPYTFEMEYRKGSFDGLKALVDDHENETVSISGKDYFVRTVNAKYDGKTFVAMLELKPA